MPIFLFVLIVVLILFIIIDDIKKHNIIRKLNKDYLMLKQENTKLKIAKK